MMRKDPLGYWLDDTDVLIEKLWWVHRGVTGVRPHVGFGTGDNDCGVPCPGHTGHTPSQQRQDVFTVRAQRAEKWSRFVKVVWTRIKLIDCASNSATQWSRLILTRWAREKGSFLSADWNVRRARFIRHFPFIPFCLLYLCHHRRSLREIHPNVSEKASAWEVAIAQFVNFSQKNCPAPHNFLLQYISSPIICNFSIISDAPLNSRLQPIKYFEISKKLSWFLISNSAQIIFENILIYKCCFECSDSGNSINTFKVSWMRLKIPFQLI